MVMVVVVIIVAVVVVVVVAAAELEEGGERLVGAGAGGVGGVVLEGEADGLGPGMGVGAVGDLTTRRLGVWSEWSADA